MKGCDMKSFFFNIILCIVFFSVIHAQDKLFKNTFPLSDVTFLDGPFKHAPRFKYRSPFKV